MTWALWLQGRRYTSTTRRSEQLRERRCYHGDGFGSHHLWRCQHDQIRHVNQQVTHRRQRNADHDGARKISFGGLQTSNTSFITHSFFALSFAFLTCRDSSALLLCSWDYSLKKRTRIKVRMKKSRAMKWMIWKGGVTIRRKPIGRCRRKWRCPRTRWWTLRIPDWHSPR